MEIPKELHNELFEYCRVNNITNVDAYMLKLLKQGFTADKFGSSPIGGEPKTIEVEKIVEKIVYQDKEVIKEVEVEKIVEKEVFVTDEEANLELKKQIEHLNKELLSTKKNESVHKKSLHNICDERKELKERIIELEGELEAEKLIPKKEDKKDIYGEKKGTFGSNLSNLWNKKQQ